MTEDWTNHKTFLTDGEYKNIFGGMGCVSEPPPSTENKICKKYHEKIKQIRKMKEDSKSEEINDEDVKAFLDTPTESLLISTDEIRFGRFCYRSQF